MHNYNIQMQATIIKELGKLQNLNTNLADYLRKLLQQYSPYSLPAARTITSTLIQTLCQHRNLLHYRHVDDRTTAEKCLLLMQDLFTRIIADRPQILQHITNEVLTHLLQHSSCFISFAFYFSLAKKHQTQLQSLLAHDRLRKLLNRIASYFQEAGELKFLKDLQSEESEDWRSAQDSLEAYLNKKYKPSRAKDHHEEVNVSLSKIPPLILPSSKSIQSSRYSAISKEERTKGVGQLRDLASSIGQGFIAVELGCLLAHKRTQQVQEFSNNSDYRYKCLQKAETDRLLSSRLSLLDSSYSQTRSAHDRQMDDTNRRYYKKVLLLLANLINLCLQDNLTSPHYSVEQIKPFYLDFFDLAVVGVIQSWSSFSSNDHNSSEFFSTIQVELTPINEILRSWGQRISFITEKKHLKLLWNRNKKSTPFYYTEELEDKEIIDQFLGTDIKVVRFDHLKKVPGILKHSKGEESSETDFVLGEIAIRINQLFGLCDMNNSRFYKYEANLLGLLANYLQNSFSNTVKYLAIELMFPLLLLVKRQIIELSHPFLQNIELKQFQSSKRFNKKEKSDSSKYSKLQEPLITVHPELFCNFLLVVSNLMSNHKHVERLLSTTFIKNPTFMETLERYVKYLFDNDKNNEIKKVLTFYRHCLEIYNQRKLRNNESKSIKILFNHLSGFFFPKIGCIAKKLEQKQHLISSSPDTNQQTILEHHFLHQLLDFVRQIYYYCQDELAQNLLEDQIASFYIKYSLLNFIKLYSFITVNELANLQADGYQLSTKESPHISYHPSVNTVYMIDFVRIITSIAINRTYQISKKIKQYRILQFFIRQFELQFEVAQNIEKYIKKVTKIIDVPPKKKAQTVIQPVSKAHPPKIPSLNLKTQKIKVKTSPSREEKTEGKKKMVVPTLKLPTRSDRSQQKGVLDSLIEKINQEPGESAVGLSLNLPLTKLSLNKNSQSNQVANSSERNLIYSSERKIRKIYSNKTLHSQSILLVLSLLLNKGLLDPQYCDQFPITHGKINALYILHHHLNEEANRSVIPILSETVGRIKPYLAGQRLLKLLSTTFTDLSHYKNWKKISAGAYGVIYGCETNIEQPREVAIKQMNFPKSIYERCVLHDIFTEISCLENFRLDDRVTTMYNYGVVSNAYVIVMKRYDCSLRDWILRFQDSLTTKIASVLKIFWDVLHIMLLLHEKSVTHYDIKADNILLQLDPITNNPTKVVLGDFGQCRVYDNSKQELDMKSRGTECIKSPEMLTLALHLKKEADNYDRRKKIGTTRASDIWSLGCLFYQMLTGQYLYHRSDWVNFYIQVTSPSEQVLNRQNQQKLQKYHNHANLIDYLKCMLIRDPKHRPEIKGAIQKFRDLFGDFKSHPPLVKSFLSVQKDLEVLVGKYLEQLKREEQRVETVTSSQSFLQVRPKQHNRVRGAHFSTSYNNSRSNKFMRIMEDIFFCQNINLLDGGYEKMKELKITHIVTTINHPLLIKFNTLLLSFKGINLAHLAFRLAPKISDLLREVLLLKGRLLFINDQTNYGTNLLIYTLSYWFRCSVYQTWCLINTQILLFPTFTSDLLSLSSALRILNDVEQRVEQLPKLQCICGSVTLILKEVIRSKRKSDLSCKCKKKKLHEYPSMSNGPDCVTTGCQAYLQFVKKRYSISWQSLKWASMSPSNLLSPYNSSGKIKQSMRTQILLNSSEPYQNMIQTGSCVKTCKVYSCKLCQMMMMATTESKDEILLVMNNMLRRIRQGIMIPNAQESFAKKTPALSYYTLTKLHMTKGPQQ